MHPRHHLLLSSAAAIAAYPWLGRRVVVPWAASLLIDLDHAPAYIRQHGLASPAAIWRHYRRGEGDMRQHALHRWPLIRAGRPWSDTSKWRSGLTCRSPPSVPGCDAGWLAIGLLC